MSTRRPLANSAVIGLISLTMLVSACSGSPATTSSVAPSASDTASPSPSASASPSPSPSVKPSPSPSPTPTPVPTPSAFTLNSQVWWSGYEISVTGGTYDPRKHNLNINATFKNTSTQQVDASSLSNGVKIVWNGQFLPGYVSQGPIPVGATASAQIQLQPPADFVVDDAVLTFGQPSEHQALVPLNGTPATSEQPTTLAIKGALKMGKFVTFTISRSLLVPASCSGYPERFKYGVINKDQVSIVLFGQATNADTLNYAQIDQGYINIPDGTTAVSNPTAGWSLAPKATLRDQAMCFPIPAPGTGSYKLTMHESRSKGIGILPFVLP